MKPLYAGYKADELVTQPCLDKGKALIRLKRHLGMPPGKLTLAEKELFRLNNITIKQFPEQVAQKR